MRIVLISAFYVLFVLTSLKSQTDTIVVKVHPLIGDTIDINEQKRFKLLSNASLENFQFGQYLMIRGKLYACITRSDKTTDIILYTPEAIIAEGENINILLSKQASISNSSEQNRRNVFLQLSYKNKRKKLKIGRTINVLLNDEENINYQKKKLSSFDNRFLRIKILEIKDGLNPYIIALVKGRAKSRVEITLSNIRVITNYTANGYLLRGGLALAFTPLATTLTLYSLSDQDTYPLFAFGLSIFYFSFKPVVKDNKVYDLNYDSYLEIIYK